MKLFNSAFREPNATKLANEGFGYIVGSIGMLSGEMPYTAFNARKSYIEENEEIIEKFNKALNKGLTYVKEHDSRDIAEVILPQFPDSSLNDIIKIVDNYKKADSWLDNTYISEESFKNLEDIMIRANLLEDYVPFNDLVNNKYSE